MATKKTSSAKKEGSRRPKPSAPKAGFTASKRRYGCGGKLKK